MGLNSKNSEVEALAIKRALLERRARLRANGRRGLGPDSLIQHFEKNVWHLIPKEVLGRRISPEEEDELLGYGPDGC